jgi:hypothetical protein
MSGMKESYPALDVLRSLFRYNPETGDIFWISPGKGKIKKKAAGTQELSGYKGIVINGKRIRAHIIAWALYHNRWPADQLDHINGIKNDNRIANLREATNRQNGKNLKIKSNNTSGTTGVGYDKINDKWRATIKVDGRQISLGRFVKIEDAIRARKHAEIKYFGEWRRKVEDSCISN